MARDVGLDWDVSNSSQDLQERIKPVEVKQIVEQAEEPCTQTQCVYWNYLPGWVSLSIAVEKSKSLVAP